MRIGRLLAILLTAALLIASCGSNNEDTSPTTPDAAPEPAAPTAAGPTAAGPTATEAAPAPVPEKLDFTAKTVDGKEFSGATLAGKPAVMWFWAPWCPTCKREAPGIAKAAQQNSDVQFVGVAAQDEVPAMQEFVDEYQIGSFPNIADTDGAVWQRFGVTKQPAFAFIGADGSVDVVRSSLGTDALQTRIDTLTGT